MLEYVRNVIMAVQVNLKLIFKIIIYYYNYKVVLVNGKINAILILVNLVSNGKMVVANTLNLNVRPMNTEMKTITVNPVIVDVLVVSVLVKINATDVIMDSILMLITVE